MPAEITMPQLSDTMSEGTLIKWHKKEGDKVKSGEVIAEVETDKATMEMEAYESGTLARITVSEGSKVPVGTIIAVLATGKEKVEDVKKQETGHSSAKSKGSAAAAPSQTAASGSGKAPTSASSGAGAELAILESASAGELHEADTEGHPATPETGEPWRGESSNGGNRDQRMRVSPLARRIASERRIDLHQIRGSGPQGRIVQKDVLAFLEQVPPAQATVGAGVQIASSRLGAGQTSVVPLSKMRATIAARLQQAKQRIPHFYTTVDVDVEEISALRARLNEQLEHEKVRLSVGDFVAKAVAIALMRHPALNSTFDGQQITRHGSINLGIAVALPEGLIVPVLRGVEQMGLKQIRLRSAELVERARAQRLRREELSGATFSVSNLGAYGLREFSAIINPPEVGILAVAAAEKRAVVYNGTIAARTMMTLTLSADHRAVDGATAADFLRTLKQLLQDPAMMLV